MIPWRARFLAARARVPSPRPRFSRYVNGWTWHVCLYTQQLRSDDESWIEVAW